MVNHKHDEKCRICLRVAIKSDYVLFDEIHKEILEVLLKKVDINENSQSIICNDCSKVLHESFAFKASCLYTEDSLTPFINSQNLGKLEISTVFHKINNGQSNLLMRNKNICRFCLKMIEKVSFTFLKDLDEPDLEMLKKVVPEMQLEAVKEPIICEICLHCFKDCHKFMNIILSALNNNSSTSLNNNSDLIWCLKNGIKHSAADLVLSEMDTKNPRELDDDTIIPKGIKREYDKNTEICQQKEENNLMPNNHEEDCIIYECDKCDLKSLDKCGLHKHSLSHKNIADIEMHRCEYCPFKTICKQNMMKHRQLHDENIALNKHKCDLCDFRGRSAFSRNNHLYTDETSKESNKCPFITKYKHSCKLCPYKTKYSTNLKNHQKTHQRLDDECRFVKKFSCKLCSFKTKYVGSLTNHQRIHKKATEMASYSCELCSFKTKYANSLKTHQITHKNIPEMFKCNLCAFVTKHKGSLPTHMKIHKGSEAKIHKCDKCPYRSKYKSNLNNHYLVHKKQEEAQLYKCQLCQFSTKRKQSLSAHHLVHKDLSEVDSFQCAKCNFRTKHKNALRNHIVAVHTERRKK